MSDVIVTGLTRVTAPKPNKGGSMILAYFDCEVRGIALNGCAFLRTSRNGLAVSPPKLDGGPAERRSVRFLEDQLRAELLRKAQDAYRLMGGSDGEWIPRELEPTEAPSLDGIARTLGIA